MDNDQPPGVHSNGWITQLAKFNLWLIRKSSGLPMLHKPLEEFYRFRFAWRQMAIRTRTVFGSTMELHLPDVVAGAIARTGRWEPGISRLIHGRLKPGDTFVDVGANIGYYSLLASMRVGPAGAVVAVEASPRISAHLRRNIELNGVGNITVVNAAASAERGEITLFLDVHGNTGHSTIMAGVAQREGHRAETKVPSDTLSQLVGQPVLTQARLIKIDVEGAERLVIEGVALMLAQFSPATEWIIELSPGLTPGGLKDTTWIFEQFLASGYRAFAIAGSTPVDHDDTSADPGLLTPLPTLPVSALEPMDVLFSKRLS